MKIIDFIKGLAGGGTKNSKGKKSTSKAKGKVSNSKRKIYKTTDGYFTGNDKIKKPRRVAVIDQRKDDGALAVVKLHSKKCKKEKDRIEGLTLSPKRHSSLNAPTSVESRVYIGVKRGKSYTPIYKNDFLETGDSLTMKEYCTIKRKAGGAKCKHRKTSRRKIKRWKNHFKK